MRNKRFFILLVSTIMLMLVSTAIGFFQILNDYLLYGESYEVVTWIHGIETISTVNIFLERLPSVMFVLFLDFVLLNCLWLIYYSRDETILEQIP